MLLPHYHNNLFLEVVTDFFFFPEFSTMNGYNVVNDGVYLEYRSVSV